VRNELVADATGRIHATPTHEMEVLPCSLVLRSVGYRGVPLPGLPFHEEHGVIPNAGGRVTGDDGASLPGVYCAGWIKRGPSGVIGTNKKDAAETVELLLEDARAGTLVHDSDESLEALLHHRGVGFVEYAGWEAIDSHERAHGEKQGRPRVKLSSWDELLARARELGSQG
jgi:ferredoxin/flavodoxin---NADP+ reductase